MAETTFSESWYRVAEVRVYLRPTVRVQRQTFRGEKWYVLEDPIDNKYYRVRPAAWEFLARLSPHTTVNSAWEAVIDLFPDEAPGQVEAVQLLSQLYKANLLFYPDAEDSGALFERQSKRRSKELRAKVLGILFTRIPLIDPDRFLVRTLPWVGWLIGPLGLLLWLVVVGAAGKIFIDNLDAFLAQGRSVLAPDNLILLYAGLVVTKLLHEMGHAYFCRKFGGEVHTLGVMLLVFTPIPYMDATSSWGFRRRYQRVLVAAAGMIVEIFVAALAMFVWAGTGAGDLNGFAYNMVFVASVSTILFNANPLLRFDGYYILSDLAGLPNLHQRSAMHLKHVWKRYVFGLKKSCSPATAPGERRWFTGFGILSNIYRIIVFAGILLFVADQFLILGILMAVMGIVGWLVAPLVKFVNYLLTSAELDRVRSRAIGSTVFLLGGLILFLGVVPFPSYFRVQGLVQAVGRRDLVVGAPGWVVEASAISDREVRKGTLLLRLENPDLVSTETSLVARVAATRARLRLARTGDPGEIEALESRLALVIEQLVRVRDDLGRLRIEADRDGWLSLAGSPPVEGDWITRGETIGRLIDPAGFEFIVAVRQENASQLFQGGDLAGTVRLRGQSRHEVEVGDFRIVPGGQRLLPSPVLGARLGGEVAVLTEDQRGVTAAEPFYLVRASLPGRAGASFADGQVGVLRVQNGSEALLPRWWRQFRQMLQRRYQI